MYAPAIEAVPGFAPNLPLLIERATAAGKREPTPPSLQLQSTSMGATMVYMPSLYSHTPSSTKPEGVVAPVEMPVQRASTCCRLDVGNAASTCPHASVTSVGGPVFGTGSLPPSSTATAAPSVPPSAGAAALGGARSRHCASLVRNMSSATSIDPPQSSSSVSTSTRAMRSSGSIPSIMANICACSPTAAGGGGGVTAGGSGTALGSRACVISTTSIAPALPPPIKIASRLPFSSK
mmetsp:Transcript_4383/g.9489  ORF Transcript_4383/g.9489 Transcript_4383/m.9489 type:complete len:236 (+) Transcript_4383:215-922(+)